MAVFAIRKEQWKDHMQTQKRRNKKISGIGIFDRGRRKCQARPPCFAGSSMTSKGKRALELHYHHNLTAIHRLVLFVSLICFIRSLYKVNLIHKTVAHHE